MSSTPFSDISSLVATNAFTWETGLAVLILVSVLNIVFSKAVRVKAPKETVPQKELKKTEALSFAYEVYPKHDEPNFGYKDVKVTKLLVHPIKVCSTFPDHVSCG
jgi:hypothetical protein